ncbi:MAG: flagellar basal body P-ring formation chaperone FlgA [Phreatobacter sp.]|nr:flagellar basal body P-ring formation chaperone FlgA [Phreatobacter sp.]
MSRARNLLAATLLAGLVLPAGAETGRPVLRLDITVAGDVVRLGDLFDNAGRHADVAVFRSPDPGHTGQVPAWRIVEAARRAGLEPESADRDRDVSVTRDARIVPLAEMEEKIAASLAGSLGLGDSSRIQVIFDRGTRPLTVERQARGQVDILRLEHDPRSGRFDAVLGIRGSGRSERTGGFRVNGTANELVEFAVPARTIGRGEVVRASDLVIDRRPRSALPMMTADTVVSLGQAVGLAARRPLSPERPFRTIDLMKPELVERNANVIIIVELPGLSLTMRGKALEAGAEGDVIQVENIQSRKKLQAVVTGLNRVSLATRPTTLAAATRTP